MWSIFDKDAKGMYWKKKDSLQQMVPEPLAIHVLKNDTQTLTSHYTQKWGVDLNVKLEVFQKEMQAQQPKYKR